MYIKKNYIILVENQFIDIVKYYYIPGVSALSKGYIDD